MYISESGFFLIMLTQGEGGLLHMLQKCTYKPLIPECPHAICPLFCLYINSLNICIPSMRNIIIMSLFYYIYTGPGSAVGDKSDCRSRGHKFDLGPVPYFRGD